MTVLTRDCCLIHEGSVAYAVVGGFVLLVLVESIWLDMAVVVSGENGHRFSVTVSDDVYWSKSEIGQWP